MVGAGFSRCSSTTADSSKKLPLWSNFSNTLQNELGTKGNTDPLRIAEEYTAYFGRQALNELIKKRLMMPIGSPESSIVCYFAFLGLKF